MNMRVRLDQMSRVRERPRRCLALAWSVSGDNGVDRVSSEYSHDESEAARLPAFEEIYPRYEFAEIVRIGLTLRNGWRPAPDGWPRRAAACKERVFGMSGQPSPRGLHPTE